MVRDRGQQRSFLLLTGVIVVLIAALLLALSLSTSLIVAHNDIFAPITWWTAEEVDENLARLKEILEGRAAGKQDAA